MNDKEREQWVLNDEGLYNMQRRSNQSMRAWIKENRDLIDGVTGNVTSGKKPAHYLEYELEKPRKKKSNHLWRR